MRFSFRHVRSAVICGEDTPISSKESRQMFADSKCRHQSWLPAAGPFHFPTDETGANGLRKSGKRSRRLQLGWISTETQKRNQTWNRCCKIGRLAYKTLTNVAREYITTAEKKKKKYYTRRRRKLWKNKCAKFVTCKVIWPLSWALVSRPQNTPEKKIPNRFFFVWNNSLMNLFTDD